jgi:hypothetical protein
MCVAPGYDLRRREMTIDSAHRAHPIDALYLIHNALRMEAERTEQAVAHLEIRSSFKALPRSYRRDPRYETTRQSTNV